MIVTKLQTCKSFLSPYEYNEKKVFEAEASVLAVRNIPGDDSYSIKRAFMDREERIWSGKTKNVTFHLAVCPGENDGIKGNDSKIVELVDRIAEELGLEGQPVVIYKHFDIEREHYHVLTTWVNEEGKIIRESLSKRAIMKVLEKYGPEYGFVIGAGEKKAVKFDPSLVIRPESENKVAYAEAVFSHALKFNYINRQRFRAVLAQSGLSAVIDDERELLKLMIKPSDGTQARPVYASGINRMSRAMYRKYRESLERNIQEERSDADRTMKLHSKVTAVLGYLLDKAETRFQLSRMMEECGMRFVPSYTVEGRLKSYMIIDNVNHGIWSNGNLPSEFSPAALDERIPEGDEMAIRRDSYLTEEDFAAMKARIREMLGLRLEKAEKKEKKKETSRRIGADGGVSIGIEM